MTEGHNIGTVFVDVRPDARDFARRFREQTGNDASAAGTEYGREWSRAAQNEMTRNPAKARVDADVRAAQARVDALRAQISRNAATLKVDVDRSSTQKATVEAHALRDAIVAIGPAAVPVGAVAVGAIAGLIPTAATAILGIKGISNEMKSGQLVGTQYGRDINQVKGELSKLETIASGGLLNGLDEAMQGSRPLFKEINGDVGVFSGQLGQIIGATGPGLLSILHQLDPLFTTIGNDLVSGAKGFEHWAQSTDSISRFVSYVQAEIPQVEHTLTDLITSVVHLGEGLAPAGNAALFELRALSTVINAIPVGVLSNLETVALATYVAFRVYKGINAIVTGVNTAVASMKAPFVASAASAQASSLATQATVAEEASAIAAAKALEARAASVAAAQIAAAVQGTDSILAESAASAAADAEGFAVAMQAEADAAAEASATIAASAAAAADAVDEAGAAAATGWSSMLGPVGAAVVGVSLLATTFLRSKQDTDTGTQAVQEFTSALEQANGVVNSSVRGSVAQKIVSNQDLVNLKQFGISTNDIVNSVTGVGPPVGNALEKLREEGKLSTNQYNDLIHTIFDLAQGFVASKNEADAYVAAQRAAQAAADGGTTAARAQATALGVSQSAYLDAQTAARQNTTQTKAQTLAFQLENDAASLLNNALGTLAGQNLDVAQAQTALATAANAVATSMAGGKTAIKGSSAAALANQQAIQGNVQAARQLATAVAKQSGSNDQAAASYKRSRQALLEQLAAHNELTPAVRAYVNRLYDVKGISDYLSAHPTKIDVNTDAAKNKLRELQAYISHLHPIVHIDAVGNVNVNGGTGRAGGISFSTNAAGGGVPDGWSTVGERGWEAVHKSGSNVQVFSNPQSRAMTGWERVPGFAGGTTPSTSATTSSAADKLRAAMDRLSSVLSAPVFSSGRFGTASSAMSSALTAANGKVSKDFVDHERELFAQMKQLAQADEKAIARASAVVNSLHVDVASSGAGKTRSSLQSAGQALTAGIRAGLGPGATQHLEAQLSVAVAKAEKQLQHLRVKVDGHDVDALDKALSGSVKDARSAFASLLADAQKVGISDKFAASLTAENTRLDGVVKQRNRIMAELGTPPDTHTTAWDRLETLLGKEKELATSVRQAVEGVFDITSAGTGPNGDQPVTGSNILAEQKQDALRAKTFVADIEKLAHRGLNPAYLQQLEGKGPAALPEAQALLGLSKSQFGQLNQTQAQINRSAKALGGFAGTQQYGDQVAAARAVVKQLIAREKAVQGHIEIREAKLEARLEEHVDRLANRPIIVKVDGKVLARATAQGANRNARAS